MPVPHPLPSLVFSPRLLKIIHELKFYRVLLKATTLQNIYGVLKTSLPNLLLTVSMFWGVQESAVIER